MCTVRDPSKSFCWFKHSPMILLRPSESFTLRWDSMKTSQITEEYGTVLIIAQRGQTSLQGWSYCLSTSLYPSKCRECGFFLKLKIRFKKRKMYYWRYYLFKLKVIFSLNSRHISVFSNMYKIDAFFILFLHKKMTAAGEGETCL